MKKRLVIFFSTLLLLICYCGRNDANNQEAKSILQNNFDVKSFKKWSYEKQANFINSLDRKTKFKFLKLFLPGSEFNLPPNEIIKFKNNKIIVFSFSKRMGENFSYSKWEIKNDKLILKREDDYSPFPPIKMIYIDDVKAVYLISNDKTSMVLNFIIDLKNDDFLELYHIKDRSGYFHNIE